MEDPFDLPPDVLRRIPLFAEIAKVLSWQGGPVNWDLARQIAVSVAAGDDGASKIDPADDEQAAEHVRLAEMWLAEESALPAPARVVRVRAATAVDWAEHAPDAFRELIDPIAAKATRAMSEHTPADMPDAGMLAQALRQMAPMFTGIQAGTILGALAHEVTADHDIGLPAAEGDLVLVMPAIDGVAADYGLDRRQVRAWVTLNAAASRMHLDGFPWVRARFFSLYHDYVASLDIDIGDGLQRLQQLDLSDPARLQDALGDEGLFAHQPSPATAQASARVSSFLSVVDAHVSIAAENAAGRLGSIAPVVEAFARRSAEPARGAKLLTDFIGLETGRDRRSATGFVRFVVAERGWTGLNRMWEDPESFPTEAELVDAAAWVARVSP